MSLLLICYAASLLKRRHFVGGVCNSKIDFGCKREIERYASLIERVLTLLRVENRRSFMLCVCLTNIKSVAVLLHSNITCKFVREGREELLLTVVPASSGYLNYYKWQVGAASFSPASWHIFPLICSVYKCNLNAFKAKQSGFNCGCHSTHFRFAVSTIPCLPPPAVLHLSVSLPVFFLANILSKLAACICGGHLITLTFVTVSQNPPLVLRAKILKIFIFILQRHLSLLWHFS